MNNKSFINNIKTFLFITGFCFAFNSVFAQSTNTEYFMKTSFSKTFINPAKRPDRGYIGIPGFSNLVVDLKTNTLNLDHLLFPGVGENGKSGWFLHENVSYNDFMKNISSMNYFGASIDYTALGFGFYVKDAFISFDVTSRMNAGVNIPKDLFGFLKGSLNAGENEEKIYNISNLGVYANAFTQVGLGGSFPFLNNSLVLGAKVKVLLGTAHADFKLDNMKININNNQWSVSTKASGVMVMPVEQVNSTVYGGKVEELDFDGSVSPVNGTGFGLDLGATFTPSKISDDSWLSKLTISAALTDIGYISWNKSKMKYMATEPSEIIITGNHEIPVDGDSFDTFETLGDALNEAFAFYYDSPTKTSSGIGAKFNWGVEYALHKKFNVGFLNTFHFNPVKTISEFTVAGAFNPVSGFEVGLSYSFVHSDFRTFGLAMNLGHFLYIASDYVIPHVNSSFIPTTTKGLNFQVGLAIPIGKKPGKKI